MDYFFSFKESMKKVSAENGSQQKGATFIFTLPLSDQENIEQKNYLFRMIRLIRNPV